MYHLLHMPSGEEVGLELVASQPDPGLMRLDHRTDDHLRWDVSDPHHEELEEGDIHSRSLGAHPEHDREVAEDDREDDQRDDHHYAPEY